MSETAFAALASEVTVLPYEQKLELLYIITGQLRSERAPAGCTAPVRKKTHRKFGIISDPDFYMAPDFDAPLDDFKEYM